MSRKSTIILPCIVAILIGIFLLTVPACNDSDGHEVTTETMDHEVKVSELRQDSATGLVVADGIQLVKANCMNCHSPKLITQARATRDGWEGMIRWMQEKHRLWDLGEQETAILDYLATHYAPDENKGRRKQLVVEWYDLEL